MLPSERERTGVMIGSGIGGIAELEQQHVRLLEKGPSKVSAFTIPKMMLNAASGHVSIQFGLRGPNAAVATACASASHAIADAVRAIRSGDADVMIAGGAEMATTPVGLGGFAMAASPAIVGFVGGTAAGAVRRSRSSAAGA